MSIINLKIYPEYSEFGKIAIIARGLKEIFPNIMINIDSILKIPKTAYDTYTKQYDADYLVTQIPKDKNNDVSLWLINKPMGTFRSTCIYGAICNSNKCIVVSSYNLEIDLLVKEIGHEVGHVLGLGHCINKCLMNIAGDKETIRKKPSCFCQECTIKLHNN